MARTHPLPTFLAAACLIAALPGFAEGYRSSVGTGEDEIPVIVVKGAPFEMGRTQGELLREEARPLLERILGACQASDPERCSDKNLDAAWEAVSPHTDPRFIEELRGIAEGAGVPFDAVRRTHMIPVVQNYSCSSIAAWGKATKNGHLYQTRNLDWHLGLGAHEYGCLVVYLPEKGVPHVNVTFAGYIGSNTGLSAAGIALSEMGDSPGRDHPWDMNGVHFTSLFRTVMYDAKDLGQAIGMFQDAKRIKKYHYVVGDGKAERRAVKMLAHAPDLVIWKDNDPNDEKAPDILEDIVYQDEERGAFPPLKERYGKIGPEDMIDICRMIPIKGGNVLDVVYDATSLELWVAFAEKDIEAYKRPFIHFDMKDYLDFDRKR